MFRREMSWFEIIIKAIIAILLLILGFGLGGCAATSTSAEGNVDEVKSSETFVEGTSVIIEDTSILIDENKEEVVTGEVNVISTVFEKDVDSSISEIEGVKTNVSKIKLLKLENYDGMTNFGELYSLVYANVIPEKEFYILHLYFNVENTSDEFRTVILSNSVKIDGVSFSEDNYSLNSSMIDCPPDSISKSQMVAYIIPNDLMDFDEDSEYEFYLDIISGDSIGEIKAKEIPSIKVN